MVEGEQLDGVEEGFGVGEGLGILEERLTIVVGSRFQQTDDPEPDGRV